MIDDEVKRAAKLLETMMKMAGINRQELDQRMGAGRGYASQVLSGRMELKYRHILGMLEALEVAPATFFGILFPPAEEARGGPSPMERLLGQLRRIGPAERHEPAPAASPDDLDRRIRAVVREMLGEPAAAPRRRPRKPRGKPDGEREE
jgi:transcriptional regulator with XRE-family HTH domain